MIDNGAPQTGVLKYHWKSLIYCNEFLASYGGVFQSEFQSMWFHIRVSKQFTIKYEKLFK